MVLVSTPACWSDYGSQKDRPPTSIGLLLDPDDKLDIEAAASAENAGRYELVNKNRISLGFNRAPLWVRVPLDEVPDGCSWVLRVAAPWLDKVDLYLPKPEGGWSKVSTGLYQPNADTRTGAFGLTVRDCRPGEYGRPRRGGYAYLRLQAVLSLNAGLAIFSRADFMDYATNSAFEFGLLFGVMGAMLMFNLIVLVATRSRVYLAYVLYLVGMIIHELCLQGQVLMLPTWAWPYVPEISLLSCVVAFYFGTTFCRRFLNTPALSVALDRCLTVVQAAAVALLPLALTGQIWLGTWLVHSLALLAPLVAVAAGVMALSQGFRPARFYLVAWIVLLLGSMAWAAWSMGMNLLVPLPQSTLTIAATVETILLTMALADRIRVIQQEGQATAQRERRYRHLSFTDELTGLYNARYFWGKLDTEIKRCGDSNEPLGLVLLDVDDFKLYNDTHGHTEGDKVLAVLGRLMQSAVRMEDSPCRYGGEEFALILPRVEGAALREIAERVRTGFAGHEFSPGDGPKVRVTVSLGTALLRTGEDALSLVNRADAALYRAKAEGKNKTIEALG